MTKGIAAERNLVKLLWKSGFAVLRPSASGASTKMTRPDIIAGSRVKGLEYAIEVKTTRNDRLYIAHESVDQLIEFSQRFGCQPILALKFKGKGKGWILVNPEQLSVTPSLNYKITLRDALQIGIDFQTLIKERGSRQN